MALCEPIVGSHPDDVPASLLQQVFFQTHRETLSRPDDYLSRIHFDDADEQRVLYPAGLKTVTRHRRRMGFARSPMEFFLVSEM